MKAQRPFIFSGIAALLLAACASGPTPPEWQANASASLDAYIEAWLRGETRLANAAFTRARSELASTGQADQLAVAELTRCALEVASVANISSVTLPASASEFCPAFAPLAADAGEKARAYAAFLRGQPVETRLLPSQYSDFSDAASLSRIAAPLPRLIAAGVLLRRNELPPAGVAAAIETASAQGWRRPLLAWLGVQERVATVQGDSALAAQAKKRAALVGGVR